MSDPSFDRTTELNETPLLMAVRRGHADTVSLLLNHGAAPEIAEKNGMKTMNYAARSNHHATIQVLLEARASPVTRREKNCLISEHYFDNTVGDTALDYAAISCSVESVAARVSNLTLDDLRPSLRFAVSWGKMPIVKYLLDTGLLDMKSNVGGQALIQAASKCNLKCCSCFSSMVRIPCTNGTRPMVNT